MIKHINIKVIGLVQGVWYRASTVAKANELGLKGFVRNERDSSVYIEAEGTAEQLMKFTLWCHNGPEGARVKKVKVEEGEVRGFEKFTLERG